MMNTVSNFADDEYCVSSLRMIVLRQCLQMMSTASGFANDSIASVFADDEYCVRFCR